MEVLSKLKINSYTSKNITISSQTKRFTHPVLSLYLDKLDCLDKHDVNNSRTSSFFCQDKHLLHTDKGTIYFVHSSVNSYCVLYREEIL